MVGPTTTPGNSVPPSIPPVSAPRELIYEESVQYSDLTPGITRRSSYLSAHAVVAGALAALAFLILSGSMATAVGLSVYAPDGTYAFGWGAGIWMVLTAIVAYFLAGALAASLSVYRGQNLGLIHGLMAWVVSLPILLFLIGSVTGGVPLFSGAFVRLSGANLALPVQQQVSSTGAAWAAVLSLFAGLLAASFGGLASGACSCTRSDSASKLAS